MCGGRRGARGRAFEKRVRDVTVKVPIIIPPKCLANGVSFWPNTRLLFGSLRFEACLGFLRLDTGGWKAFAQCGHVVGQFAV